MSEKTLSEIVSIASEKLPQEWTSYFLCFALFERCLKSQGSIYVRQQGSMIKIDHSKFFDDALCSVNGVAEEILHISIYIKNNPPRKQEFNDGRVSFVEHSVELPLVSGKSILGALPSVRNNLFHGGKWPLCPLDEPARDQELLVEARSILLLLMARCKHSSNPNVRGVGRAFKSAVSELAGKA